MRYFILVLGLSLSLHLISQSAFGNCTGSFEGAINFDPVDNRLEYCDFNVWRPFKYNKTKSNITTVYNQDFESGVAGSEWGADYSVILTSFLGRFGSTGNAQGPAKTFAFSGTQDTITIEFDLYQIDDWDGDAFRVYIDDVATISSNYNDLAFSSASSGSLGNVSWTITPQLPLIFQMGFASQKDGIYHYSLTITSSATSLKLGFGNSLTVPASVASFGIDNLVINSVTSGVPTNIVNDDFESGVPADDWGNGQFYSNTDTFLGEYGDTDGNPIPSRTITWGGPPIDSTTVTFDALIFGSWDTEAFRVYFDDVQVYSYNFTGSYVLPPAGSNGNVSWTVTPVYAQLQELNGNYQFKDKAFTYTFTYTNPGASQVKIGFGGATNEGVGNESWGIDNINVSTVKSGTPTVRYSQDFEGVVAPDEFGADVGFQFGSFLGRFGNTGGQGPNRSFNLPTTQTSSTLDFDLYELDSVDDEAFTVYIDNVAVYSFVFSGSRYDIPTSGSSGAVSWTVSNLTPVAGHFGFASNYTDQAYHYSFTYNNPGNASIKVGFGAATDQALSDEAFGVDNISLTYSGGGGGTVYTSNFNSGLDEMAWLNHTPENTALTTVLGPFEGTGGAQGLNRTFTLPGTQTSTTIIFDIWELETWDNETFRIFVDDTLVITSPALSLNVYNSVPSGSLGNVSWVASQKSFSNHDMYISWSSGGYFDQAYKYVLTVTNPGATSIKIGFGATINESITNEAWAIDNFRLYHSNSGVDSTVYESDFESGATGWSVNTTTFDAGVTNVQPRTILDTGLSYSTPFTNNESSSSPFTYVCTDTEFGTSTTTVLGRFYSTGGGQGPHKTFALPGTQEFSKITFDMVETGTWDTEGFQLWINDAQIFSLTFKQDTYDVKTEGTTGNVYWRSTNISGPSYANLGFSSYDQIVRFTAYVSNPGATSIKVGFGSSTDSGDELTGIDNVKVEHFDSAAQGALTTCTKQGNFYYDTSAGAMVFCDGSSLWLMGPPFSGSGGCAPSGVAGSMEYDYVQNNLKYCDGSGWVEIDNW